MLQTGLIRGKTYLELREWLDLCPIINVTFAYTLNAIIIIELRKSIIIINIENCLLMP